MFDTSTTYTTRPLLLLAALLLVVSQVLSANHLHLGADHLPDHECASCHYQDTGKAAVSLVPVTPPQICAEQEPALYTLAVFSAPQRRFQSRAPPVYA